MIKFKLSVGHDHVQTFHTYIMLFIMPPTSKQLRGHIGLGLFVCLSIPASVAYGQE